MRINQLNIENYRGFEGEHTLEFSDSPITAIVGVNGAGKTSLLNVVANFLYNFIPRATDDLTTFQISEKDINSNDLCKIEGIFYNSKLDISEKYAKSLRIKPFTEVSQITGSIIEQVHKNIYKYNDRELPIFIYYQTNRNFDPSSSNNVKQDNGIEFKRNDTYTNAFNPSIDFQTLLTWYVLQKNIENNKKIKYEDFDYQSPILTTTTSALNQFLSTLDGNKLTKLAIESNPDSTQQILVLHKGEQKLELTQLSAGEKMMTGMVLDIAYRMGIANPHLENPLLSEGIVLIDELELHLHPKWQMTVLQALNKTFPNIQFIVTTHSPLVINSLKNDQLVILDDFKIIQGRDVRNTYGRDVNSIVEDFMGASDRPKDIKSKLQEIASLLDEDNLNISMAKEKLATLKSIIDPNDYDILKLETLITIEEDEADY